MFKEATQLIPDSGDQGAQAKSPSPPTLPLNPPPCEGTTGVQHGPAESPLGEFESYLDDFQAGLADDNIGLQLRSGRILPSAQVQVPLQLKPSRQVAASAPPSMSQHLVVVQEQGPITKF